MSKILLTTAIIFGISTALLLVVRLIEPRLSFHPWPGGDATPDELGIDYRSLWVKTKDGEQIHIWHLEHPQKRAQVFYFHGNGGNLSLWLYQLSLLYHQSLSVWALDYRGFGKSSGTPTEIGFYQDVQAAVTHFWQQNQSSRTKVYYWGRSLGGVAAAYASTIRQPDGIILESTLPSASSFTKHSYVLYFLSFFSSYRFPTLEFLEKITCPILVIHGDQDQIIPFSLGVELFRKLKTPKHFFRVKGAGHDNVESLDSATYWKKLNQFFQDIENG